MPKACYKLRDKRPQESRSTVPTGHKKKNTFLLLASHLPTTGSHTLNAALLSREGCVSWAHGVKDPMRESTLSLGTHHRVKQKTTSDSLGSVVICTMAPWASCLHARDTAHARPHVSALLLSGWGPTVPPRTSWPSIALSTQQGRLVKENGSCVQVHKVSA